MRRFYQRRVNSLCMKRVNDPVGDVSRVSRIADMLELTPATDREMATLRRYMLKAAFNFAVGQQSITRRGQRRVTPICGDTFSARGNADDPVGVAHNVAGRR
jgi:hypothetical protein